MIKSEQSTGLQVIMRNNTINSPKCSYTEIAKEYEQLQELHNPWCNSIMSPQTSLGILAPSFLSHQRKLFTGDS